MRHPHQAPVAIPLLDLPVDQVCRDLPLARPPPGAGHPLPEVRGQGVERVVQAIADEDREAAGGQPPSEVVYYSMGRLLGARS
jgi:hypothetical protein